MLCAAGARIKIEVGVWLHEILFWLYVFSALFLPFLEAKKVIGSVLTEGLTHTD